MMTQITLPVFTPHVFVGIPQMWQNHAETKHCKAGVCMDIFKSILRIYSRTNIAMQNFYDFFVVVFQIRFDKDHDFWCPTK